MCVCVFVHVRVYVYIGVAIGQPSPLLVYPYYVLALAENVMYLDVFRFFEVLCFVVNFLRLPS